MDAVLDSPSFKPFEIRMVNYCRLYLRVTTLADITTAKGDAIDSGMYQGTPNLSLSTAGGTMYTRRGLVPRHGAAGERLAGCLPTGGENSLHSWVVIGLSSQEPPGDTTSSGMTHTTIPIGCTSSAQMAHTPSMPNSQSTLTKFPQQPM